MKNFLFIYIILISASISINSQSKKDFTFSVNGYVKTDIIYDSRETVNLREGHLLLYPQNKNLDEDFKDINAQSKFNILSIQSRLTGKIAGPMALGAKTSGIMEAEFFGHTNEDINGFRLRLAYINLQWEKTSVIAGQYWHPMFITEVFPNVVSFNTGIPFQPFSRNPQVRIKHNFGIISLAATAYTQRDFSSPGPEGTSSTYLRNSGVPGLNITAMIKLPNMIFGIGGDYKTLRPRLITNNNYSTNEEISSFAGMAFGKYEYSDFSIKIEGAYGGNLNDLLMLGGYAVYDTDEITDIKKYTPLHVISFWTDISYGKQIEFGVFAGYSENKATSKSFDEYYSRGINIDYLYRISPRVLFNFENFRIASEFEYTVAAYGDFNNKGEVYNSEEVNNLRILTAVYLFF